VIFQTCVHGFNPLTSWIKKKDHGFNLTKNYLKYSKWKIREKVETRRTAAARVAVPDTSSGYCGMSSATGFWRAVE
jgi:hypothetical protein